jgi:hypothetical protein
MKTPVHEVRLGLIKVSIWKSETRHGDRHNVTLCRLFKNGDVWQQSTQFGRDDLLLAAKALDVAHTWIIAQSQENPDASPIGASNVKPG